MNREIKFRTWDKEEKKMHYSDSKLDYDIWFSLARGKVECLQNCAYTDSFGDEHDDWQPLDNIMQYIGLRDKNGKEIYEGDIVEIPKEDGYFKIEWDGDSARFVMNGDGLTVDFDNFWSYEIEVVGNRFDNPELLDNDLGENTYE